MANSSFELPPGLLESVCYVESGHDVGAVHLDDGNGNSVGICQIKLSTAQWMGFRGTEQQLMIPRVNIYYAAKYLKRNLVRYNGNIPKALTAYNRGSAGNLTLTNYSIKVLKQWTGEITYAQNH